MRRLAGLYCAVDVPVVVVAGAAVKEAQHLCIGIIGAARVDVFASAGDHWRPSAARCIADYPTSARCSPSLFGQSEPRLGITKTKDG
jgi:hypothetical protein